MKRSARCSVMAPMIIPRTAIQTLLRSMAGIMRLKKVAANAMPAENPSMISSSLSETFLVNSTGRTPAPVAKPAIELAAIPSQIVSVLTHHLSFARNACGEFFKKKEGGNGGGKRLLEEFGDEG